MNPAGLVAFLGLLGVGAETAAVFGTVVTAAAATTVVSTALNLVDIALEIDHPVFNAVQDFFSFTNAVVRFPIFSGNLVQGITLLPTIKWNTWTTLKKIGTGIYGIVSNGMRIVNIGTEYFEKVQKLTTEQFPKTRLPDIGRSMVIEPISTAFFKLQTADV